MKPDKKIVNEGMLTVLSAGLLFTVTFLYFLFFGNYIFDYQDRQILFIYSASFFEQYASRPGGLLEYAGAFFSQAFFSPAGGAFILSMIILSVALVYRKIFISIAGKIPLSALIMLFPAAAVILIQSNFNFYIYHSIGILLAALSFHLVSRRESIYYNIAGVVLFPLLFYIIGGYAWLYAGMYASANFMKRGIRYPALILAVAAVSLVLFRNVLFSRPLTQLLYSPLPLPSLFKHQSVLYLFFLLLVFFPPGSYGLSRLKMINSDTSFTMYGVATMLSLVIFVLSRIYNPSTVFLFRLEKMFYSKEWDALISSQENKRSGSLIAQYYYNIALSEKGLLCSRLFYGPQNYGTKSLLIPWDSNTGINMIYRGAYFYYTVGLINEAHRWAFESMVMQGYNPENIRLLIKTELINGNFPVAKKYINVLKKTIRYHAEAIRYEQMLGKPDLVMLDNELGKKSALMPKSDFMIRLKNQQDNVPLILKSNPSNKVAFEYMIAWNMLEKNLDKIIEETAGISELGYSKLPLHIEEALAYASALERISTGRQLSQATSGRFRMYNEQSLRIKTAASDKLIKKNFGNTLWYYLDFK